MYLKLAIFSLVTSGTFSAMADGLDEWIWASDLPYDLAQVTTNNAAIRIDYSGRISGHCGLSLANSSSAKVSIQAVLDKLNVAEEWSGKPTFQEDATSAGHRVTFQLRPNLYVDFIDIGTKSGRPLDEELHELGTDLVVSTVPCVK